MAPNIGSLKSIVVETAPDRIVRRQGDEALPYVAGRRNVEMRSEAAGRSSVVGHGDHGINPSGVAADGFERSCKTLPSPHGNNMRSAPVEAQRLEERFRLSVGRHRPPEGPHPGDER